MPADLAEQFALDPAQFLGIPFALIGAVLLSLGTQYQHRGVRKVEVSHGPGEESGLGMRQLGALLRRPSWVVGTLMLGFAIVFQIVALVFSPLIVVQPLGVLALVVTAVVNARVNRIRLNRATITAVGLCVSGVVVFVTIAAFTATEFPIRDRHLVTILILLAVVLVIYAVAFVLLRHRMRAFAYVVAAGILYGFLVTLAKVVIERVLVGDINWLLVLCGVGIIAAAALGAYFVQNAHTSGPPDLVVAGLTVVDPLVAIAIGIVVLDEARYAPLWAVIAFVVAGLAAVVGVILLSRAHPEAQEIRTAIRQRRDAG